MQIKKGKKLTFGERIAKFITEKIGTMICAAIFAIIAFVSLPVVIASHNALIFISWLAQTFLQLVLLPIIILGQNVQSKQTEEMDIKHYKTLLRHEEKIDRMIRHLKVK
jgi:hypothetical protein